MSSARFLWPLAACAITGLALFVTRGVLDQSVTATGVVRFAMLPPWQALFGFICLAGLLLVGIDHLNAPRGTTSNQRPRIGELVLPLFALIVLLLPFTPLAPDRWPALQALAGPLGAVVWLSVAALQIWVLWQSRLVTARAIERWSVVTITAAVFTITAGVAGIAAQRLTGTALFPSGDEPHYLVMAQSLWRDGDLKIENNHTRGDYREYFAEDLEPHYLTRGADAEIYSIHPVGLSVILAPIYALAGYKGTVWALILMGAAAAALAWRWTLSTINAPGAATFAWAAIALSAPFLFNTFTIYPEIAAALAVMFAFTTTVRASQERVALWMWALVGIAIAALPWLSTKYAPMSAALLVVVLLRFHTKSPAAVLRDPRAWTLVAIYAVSLAGWFAFFYAIWGTPLPMAPYGALVQTTPWNLRFGAPGLFFDQEYGLLAYAPVYVLAGTGLYQMWRSGAELRRQALEIIVIFVALLVTVGAFAIWWGGTSAPARPIASGLPLLMLPIAIAFRAAPVGSPRRAAQHLLLWISVGIALTLAMGQDGLLINNARDGSSALLEYWSPRWELWSLAPTFVDPVWTGRAWIHTAWWLVIATGSAMLLSRARATRAGTSALIAFATFSGALLIVALTMPWLPAGPPLPRIDLGARSRLASLDGLDSRARPASIVYDPLHRGAAADAVPQMILSVNAGQRSDKQPVRVIHNGRFSLPTGNYTLAVKFTATASGRALPISLQIGRNGPPLHTWTLQSRAGEVWQTPLWLPVDASFVGLRGPSELERDVASITITPVSVADTGDRPRVPTVLSAADYRVATLFFHDEKMYPETQGFWTLGGEIAHITVAIPPGQTGPVVMRVHSGSANNTATFSTFGWQHAVDLVPGTAVDVQLPGTSGVIPLEIAVESGFRPRDADSKSTDSRFLGIWVEVRPAAATTVTPTP